MSVGGITLVPIESPESDPKLDERAELERKALLKAENHGLSIERVKGASLDDLKNFIALTDVAMKRLRMMSIDKGQITLALPETGK